MSKRTTGHTLDEKLKAVLSVLDEKKSMGVVSRDYQIAEKTIKSWVRKYQSDGIDGLKESKTWKAYSQELKRQAVDYYLAGQGSLSETCARFNISTSSVLRRWIKRYTSGKDLKSTSEGNKKMSTGRKTTLQERIEIVQYAIAHDLDYHGAAEKYQVSYQQVYGWVRKYQADGEIGLHDRRGKTLESKSNLTEVEKLKLRIKELDHRNRYLETENGLLKKLKGNRKEGQHARLGIHLHKFQAIHDYHEETKASIQLLCQLLEVSRSGYYKWLNHTPTDQQEENEWLLGEIKRLFNKHQGILGYRRITVFINRRFKKQYNRKRIRRLMIKLCLKSFIRRSNGYCTKTSYVNIEDNVLNRAFTASQPNQKWVTDITHLHYGLGNKAYLSVIKDLYDGSVVAYKVGHFNNNALVMDTLKAAIEANPDANPLLHSDRGSQYTSKEYRYITTQAGITRSMSRVGKCIDNAPIESFFGHFKCEKYTLKPYKSYEELVNDIDQYMRFYNEERYQEKLNNLAPMEYRYQAVA
ncbi:IS3 family transposase [Jeotgalibacillus sp. R-1-5s-1]|uniref:IS3 family transposase n=1 Tax=Jeotgalibacillus sp. R-1-5s-1 TaxID=2555897 RepID=UPI00106B27A4|nr:IS3 family transposase [Jeotgalibacillus sp. R-1-5s-1]TFD94488.1 IS3 family transposase [Jeotgalibacillus sp. R-1-5s-1]